MRKIGCFFFSFVPFIFAILLEFFSAIFVFAVSYASLSPFIHKGDNSIFLSMRDLLSNVNFNACIMCVYSLFIIALYGLLYYRNFGGEYLPDPKQTFNLRLICGTIILVPGAQFACSYLIAILSSIFPSWLEEYDKLLETAGLSDALTLLLFLYTVLLGPVCEELIFRGLTLKSIRRIFPFWAANIFQAVLFGMYHMNLMQGIYAAFLGLLLGYICERGGSIYYSILLHILFNFWSTVFSRLLPKNINEMILSILMLLGMFLSIYFGTVLFHNGKNQLQKQK